MDKTKLITNFGQILQVVLCNDDDKYDNNNNNNNISKAWSPTNR